MWGRTQVRHEYIITVSYSRALVGMGGTQDETRRGEARAGGRALGVRRHFAGHSWDMRRPAAHGRATRKEGRKAGKKVCLTSLAVVPSGARRSSSLLPWSSPCAYVRVR